MVSTTLSEDLSIFDQFASLTSFLGSMISLLDTSFASEPSTIGANDTNKIHVPSPAIAPDDVEKPSVSSASILKNSVLSKPQTSPSQQVDTASAAETNLKVYSSSAVNVWQARKIEMSKRYTATSNPPPHHGNSSSQPPPSTLTRPSNASVVESLPSPEHPTSHPLPNLSLNPDLTAWPAPSEDIPSKIRPSVMPHEPTRDNGSDDRLNRESKAESDKKPSNGKKIQWKPIRADITHNAPLPTNHPASVRAQRTHHKKDGTHLTSHRGSQAHVNQKSVKALSAASDDLTCVVDKSFKSSSEEMEKNRIRSELIGHPTRPSTLRQAAHLPPAYPEHLTSASDTSHAVGIQHFQRNLTPCTLPTSFAHTPTLVQVSTTGAL